MSRTGAMRLSDAMRGLTPLERFTYKYVVTVAEPHCWLWVARVNADGYGTFKYDRKSWLAHRWAYTHFVGPIPAGLQLDHFRCDTITCVNPEHVRPVTPRENTLRSNAASSLHLAQTECFRGHPFVEANTYVYPVSGKRMCRTCYRAYQTARRAKLTTVYQ